MPSPVPLYDCFLHMLSPISHLLSSQIVHLYNCFLHMLSPVLQHDCSLHIFSPFSVQLSSHISRLLSLGTTALFTCCLLSLCGCSPVGMTAFFTCCLQSFCAAIPFTCCTSSVCLYDCSLCTCCLQSLCTTAFFACHLQSFCATTPFTGCLQSVWQFSSNAVSSSDLLLKFSVFFWLLSHTDSILTFLSSLLQSLSLSLKLFTYLLSSVSLSPTCMPSSHFVSNLFFVPPHEQFVFVMITGVSMPVWRNSWATTDMCLCTPVFVDLRWRVHFYITASY